MTSKKDLSVMIVVSVNRAGAFGGEGLPIHQEHLVIPLERIDAADPGDMVRRAVANVIGIAGFDGSDDEEKKK